jgi:hypothetical protein
MKNYDVANYTNLEELYADLTTELNELVALPVQVEHCMYGDGQIVGLYIFASNGELRVMSTINFEGTEKKFDIGTLLMNKLIEIEEPAKTIIKDFVADCKILQAEVRAAESARLVARMEADRLAKEQAKQAAKAREIRDRTTKEFDREATRTRTQETTNEFYYALGWLAKNVGTVSAKIPDYLLTAFQTHFGSEYIPTIVDTSKKTSGNNAMQWTFSMKASISKKATSPIPSILQQYLSTSGEALTNTSFIWNLVASYGFRFGKTQDIEQIRSTIPTNYLADFENGYAE